MRTCSSRWLAVLLLVFAGAAHAQRFTDLRVEPNPATAGRPVNFVFHWATGCAYDESPPGVSVEGAVVNVGMLYLTLCSDQPRDVVVPLGNLEPGTYTLRFTTAAMDGVGIPISDPPIDIPFGVTGGGSQTAFAAPVGGWPAYALLGGFLMLLAGWRLRSRA